MKQTPFVSVLMPVYNAGVFLETSVQSILNQSYSNFELVLINDGSTDQSLECLKKIKDPRLKIIDNEENIKLIATLNRGIEICSGEYIVRMDADDIAMPNRIHELVRFMVDNPTVVVCGSFYEVVNNQLNVLDCIKNSTDSDVLKLNLLFFNPICHPTSIWRRSTIVENKLFFRKEYIHAEEYKFWCELALFGDLANIPQVLLKYRVHDKQISKVYEQEQAETAKKIRKELLDSLIEGEDVEIIETWEDIVKCEVNAGNSRKILQLIERILNQNKLKNQFSQFHLERKLSLCKKNAWLETQKISFSEWRKITSKGYCSHQKFTFKQKLFLFSKIHF